MPDAKTTRARDHQRWYDENAAIFSGALAIELPFLGLDPDTQARLNRFRLWALTEDRLVEWRGLDVLEFGAGHGRFAVEMAGYRSYLGVDYSANLVRLGEQRLQRLGIQDRARLICGDCLDFSGPPDAFDLVCCLGMLPYVDDLEGVIRKMAYHTRPGGAVLADFRHATPVYTLMRQVKWRIRPQTGGGSRAHSKRQLRKAMASAGLVDLVFVMREYPWLDNWYAQGKKDWALGLRQALSRRSWLDWAGMIGFVAARKPA